MNTNYRAVLDATYIAQNNKNAIANEFQKIIWNFVKLAKSLFLGEKK